MLLFSGHRVDAPGRALPRFPPSLVPRAAAAIDCAVERALHDIALTRRDAAGRVDPPMRPAAVWALTQGAAGGDLLFAEAALRHGLNLQLLQPLPQADFVDASVRSSADGPAWVQRYDAVVKRLKQPPQSLPPAGGKAKADADDADADADSIYVRCNLWLLQTALRRVGRRGLLHLICLWNGAADEGPGGTEQMIEAVRGRGGQVDWIDIRKL